MNPYLLVLLGVAAFLVIPNFIGLAKLDISLKSVIPLSIEENKITLNAGLQFKNNSSVNLIVKRMACDVLLNGQKLGTITQNLNVPLLAGRSQVISNYVEIRSDILGEQLWRDAINMNLQNFVLQFAGDIWINNIKYPFLSTWTIVDFINAKGHQRTSVLKS